MKNIVKKQSSINFYCSCYMLADNVAPQMVQHILKQSNTLITINKVEREIAHKYVVDSQLQTNKQSIIQTTQPFFKAQVIQEVSQPPQLPRDGLAVGSVPLKTKLNNYGLDGLELGEHSRVTKKSSNGQSFMVKSSARSRGNAIGCIDSQINFRNRNKNMGSKRSALPSSRCQKLQDSGTFEKDLLPQAKRDELLEQYQKKRESKEQVSTTGRNRQEILNSFKRHIRGGKQFKFTFSNEGEVQLYRKKLDNKTINVHRIIPTSVSKEKVLKIRKTSASRSVNVLNLRRMYTQISERCSSPTKSTSQGKAKIQEPKKPQLNQSRKLKRGKSQITAAGVSTQQNSSIIVKSSQKAIQNRRRVFENNQMRQTSSVPFFKPSTGIRYTQLSGLARRKGDKMVKNQSTGDRNRNARSSHQASFTSHVLKHDYHLQLAQKLKTQPTTTRYQNVTVKTQPIKPLTSHSQHQAHRPKQIDKMTATDTSFMNSVFEPQSPYKIF